MFSKRYYWYLKRLIECIGACERQPSTPAHGLNNICFTAPKSPLALLVIEATVPA
jgi:hypothetical protein